MAGGGGAAVLRTRTQKAGRRQHPTASLPLDILLQIAARTDPVTLVRCAATCRDVRRRAADDPAFFRRCLRLRHAADRFVPPLLRGHIKQGKDRLFLVDTTAALAATASSPIAISISGHDGGEFMWRRQKALASRDGLLLVRTTDHTKSGGRAERLHVCDPVTGRSQALPPEPWFPDHADSYERWDLDYYDEASEVHYVLIVGDGDGADADAGGGCSSAAGVGRPFQVLKLNLVLGLLVRHGRYLQMQTFSSEHGAWGRYTRSRTLRLHGSLSKSRGRCRPLAVGNNTVYWLCLTDIASYVLKIKLVTTSTVTVTALPVSFPRTSSHSYLLATMAAGGSPVVLVTDNEKISAWVQKKRTAKWAKEPQVVIECEAILRFQKQAGGRQSMPAGGNLHVHLMWFAERSGIVLVRIDARGSFWLDLRFMKIVRSSRALNGGAHYPYEMDLASWVPTFSSAF